VWRISSLRSCSRREQRPRGLCLQRQAGESRADTIVQITAQTAAFLLTGQDQPFPRALQVLAQQPHVHRGTELAGQIAHQPLLFAGCAGTSASGWKST
jgi:hypothetical protein